MYQQASSSRLLIPQELFLSASPELPLHFSTKSYTIATYKSNPYVTFSIYIASYRVTILEHLLIRWREGKQIIVLLLFLSSTHRKTSKGIFSNSFLTLVGWSSKLKFMIVTGVIRIKKVCTKETAERTPFNSIWEYALLSWRSYDPWN